MTIRDLVRRHLRYGWWCLAVFLTLGIALEAMHGLKLGFYLDVTNSTRRLMWTLAHAHGTLLALVNIAFAVTVSTLARERDGGGAGGGAGAGTDGADGTDGSASRADAGRWRLVSRCLLVGGWLLPAGFVLGGVWIYDGDPGLGILLVPVGALILLVGVIVTARRM